MVAFSALLTFLKLLSVLSNSESTGSRFDSSSFALSKIMKWRHIEFDWEQWYQNHISFKLSKRSVAYAATVIKTVFVHFFYKIKKIVQINTSLFCQTIGLFKSFQSKATAP